MFNPAEVQVGDTIEEFDCEGAVRVVVEKVESKPRTEMFAGKVVDRWTEWTFSGHRGAQAVAIKCAGPVAITPGCGIRFVARKGQ